MASEDDRSVRDTWLGFGLCLLLHLLQVPMLRVLQGMAFWWIGASQLIYIVPAILIAKSRGRPGIVKGLIIGPSLPLLLNAACFGLFTLAFRSSYKR